MLKLIVALGMVLILGTPIAVLLHWLDPSPPVAFVIGGLLAMAWPKILRFCGLTK